MRSVAAAAEVGQRKARIVLMLLKRAGAVREHRGGSWSRSVEDVTRVDLSAALDEWDERRDLDRERLSAMIGYCRSAKCRTVLSSLPISRHRWLPSTIVMVPISGPQSWNGMNAVSMRSDEEEAQ